MTRVRQLAPVPLRVVMGLAFVVHGYPKIAHLGLTAQNFSQRGFVPGLFWGPLVALVEFVGGACVVLGLLTRYWSAAIAIEMVVTTLRVKVPRGVPFVARGGTGAGYELDLIYLAAALTLVVLGSGAGSLDRTVLRRDV
jgi:putative oxidoreductase